MAEARIFHDEFKCPVCQDLLKDPVTIQCGHSYCKSCITDCWDQEDQKRVYSCPQCRQTFSPRPDLATNTMLAEVVEKVKNRKRPADCDAGAGDVQCDVCTGRKYKAIKSCLMCLNSYCLNHLEQHESWFKGKRHNLTEATGRLQEMICQKHKKILEVFCHTDQKLICMLCTIDGHKNHNIVSAVEQSTEKQHQLKETQKTLQQRIQQREKDLQQLRETVESHKRSAQTAVEDSERIFTELIRSIERSRSELIRLIRDQEKTAVSRAEDRLERLEQEINDLRRRDAELEQLSHTQDHIQFLQSLQSLSAPPESTDGNDDLFNSLFSSDGLKESVHQLRDKLENFCKEKIKKISDRVTFTNIVPRTRNDFLQYFHKLTLDLNTMNQWLRLSERKRAIIQTKKKQPYPDHPDRFDHWYQVLCRESVCGRCYWELEWTGTRVFISVSYKSISRKGRGDECGFGSNDQSWSLICFPSSFSFRHNNIETVLPVIPISSRIGVFVDHRAGTLSFYSVSDTMSLIHTVQTTFTQPLYPGFNVVRRQSSVKLC
ncbi:tripartite motif-containing protein 16-like [Carassius gibelio]|uniref:tripartite motif-containing protein 16-like n=1 Tax=Carassius gibelio TaxID=101364 RepID=UPI002279DDA5|nr:tripartite motif-containing protein 16-like [Carassius gibelio]